MLIPSRKQSTRLPPRSPDKPLSQLLRCPCRIEPERWFSSCKTIIGCGPFRECVCCNGVEQGEVLSKRRSVQLHSAGMPGLRRLPQDLADFGGKLIRAERFLYELRSGTQDPDIDRRILGVGRHVENL